MGRNVLFFIFFMLITGIARADTIHVIAKGETVYSLSKRYGVSPEAIIRSNSITNTSGISIGTRLLIPSADLSANGDIGLYKAKRGDTYYSIAKKLGLSLEHLLALNGRNESRLLRIGEELIVSASQSVSREQMPGVSTRGGSLDEKTGEGSREVVRVPWWPVNGKKRILDGKLAGVGIESEPLSYVYAVAGGKVVWTGPYRGFGYVVLVDSKGYIYLYGGNEDLFVNTGQTVDAGSRIGRLGPSGASGVSHGNPLMIFAVFRDGVPVLPSEAPRG